MPLMVALAGWLFISERLGNSGIVGLILGFSGVMIIMWARLTQGVDVLVSCFV